MNSTKQTGKFSRFLKNNAALLLIIFCILAIGAVILVVSLSKTAPTLPDDGQVVVKPGDGENDQTPDDPVVNPPKPTTQIVKTYFVSPLQYTTVTMAYTEGVDFVFNKTLNMWKTHGALDLSAPDGTDVVAMFDGVVVDVSESYGMGNVVKIDHGENIIATYASLGNVEVVKGQQVQRGEKIGEASTTASYEFSDGAHLHLEVTKDGKATDPTPFVNGEIFRETEVEVTE